MDLPLHVEVVQKRHSRASKDHIREIVNRFVSSLATVSPGTGIPSGELQQQPELSEHVDAVTFCDVEHAEDVAPGSVELRYLVHRLDAAGAERDSLTDGAAGEDTAAADVWALPAQDFHGLWESLVFDSSLKRDVVRYVECALELAARGVDPHVVGCNRVLLLHGPPGTGKTSLCRALAHKLAVRLAGRFPRARLVEINAHGLFSRWFAESGKLVARLFEHVHELAADPRLLACVLVDEVESLAHARRAALAGVEPSDAVRAVNALLTQLDRLRRLPNVLVLTTSNVTGAIDVAFVDRADIKRRVGPPGARAALRILRGCCAELVARDAVAAGADASEDDSELEVIAQKSAMAALSARALRRLPFLALVRLPVGAAPSQSAFVSALAAALQDHLADAEAFLQDEADPPHVTNGLNKSFHCS